MTVGFSQTFPLKRHTLGKALMGFLSNPKMRKTEQKSVIGKGSNEVEGYIRWLSIMGLRDSARQDLTALGKLIAENDPEAELVGTQWVLHYLLSSDSSPQGAEAWYHFVNRFLPLRRRFDRSELRLYLEQESGIRTANRKGSAADLGLILSCYTSRESLGELDIIELIDNIKQSYRCGVPQTVPPLILAYVLYSQREKLYPDSSSVSIPEVLSADGNVGKILLIKEDQLDTALVQLQTNDYIRVMSFADLNHIAFVFKGNSIDILRQFYEYRKR